MAIFLTVWKNRLQKFFDNPRAILPFLKKRMYYSFVADSQLKHYKDFKYLDYNQTIDYVIHRNASIVRFGDELFDMLQGIGLYYGTWRQRYDNQLAGKLKEIISSQNPKLLVCFNPEFILHDKAWFREQGIPEQYHFWTNAKMHLKNYYHKDNMYGSALCFTPRYNKQIPYEKLKKFFESKNIIIVTSQIERFKNIKLGRTTFFIEAPGSDAWQSYEKIKGEVLSLMKDEKLPKEGTLTLVSMGSAAKVLVYDLTLAGYTAWDTGQFFDLAFQEIKKISNRS